MIILNSLDEKIKINNISIGVFDGIHLGHQQILKKLKEKKGKSAIITFSNNPLQIFNPSIKTFEIYDNEKKLYLLKKYLIDVIILIKFTKEFSNLSYIDFIKKLKNSFDFENLIVGQDVKLGKNALGDKKALLKLQNVYNFNLEAIEKLKYQNKIISSTWIRKLILEKKYNLVEKLLTRKYKLKEK